MSIGVKRCAVFLLLGFLASYLTGSACEAGLQRLPGSKQSDKKQQQRRKAPRVADLVQKPGEKPTSPPTQEPPSGHVETIGDPPAKGVRGLGETPAHASSRNSFHSVQVNVNSNGNNIVGDAANEPSIAVDPTEHNRMAIGWRQFDTISSNFRQAGRGFSTDAGASWTFPGVFEPGIFRSDPVLGYDPQGNFYYYSLRGSSGWSCEMFKSSDGGVTWTSAIPAGGGDKAWMTLDRSQGPGQGNIYLAWSPFFSCCSPGFFTRSTDGGNTYMAPIALPLQLYWGMPAVGPDGELYVCGTQTSGIPVIVKSTNAQNAAVTPTFPLVTPVNLGGFIEFSAGPNPGGLLGQFSVMTDHSFGPNRGNVYMLGSVDPNGVDPLDVMFVRSTDGGSSFSPPLRINTDPAGANNWQWFAALSVAPNGRLDAIWNDTRNDPNEATLMTELFYSCSTDGGVTWSPDVAVSQPFDPRIGHPNQAKIGDYYDLVSDITGVDVAYSATFNGEQDVYYLRIDAEEKSLPLDEKLLDGQVQAGTIANLGLRDGSTFDLEPRFTLNLLKQKIHLILQGEISTPTPDSLSFTLVSRMQGGTFPGDVVLTVEFFDFQTRRPVKVYEGAASLADTAISIAAEGDLSRFIEPITNTVDARVTWKSDNFLNEMFRWDVSVDQAVWTIKQ